MKWGNIFILVTFGFTVLAIICWVLLGFGMEWFKPWVASFTILATVAWAILFIWYLDSMSTLRQSLDELIQNGEHIKARQLNIPTVTEAFIDKYQEKMSEWDGCVETILKGTEWENSYKETIGFVKPDDESSGDHLVRILKADRNYMTLRLTKLKEIRDSLRN